MAVTQRDIATKLGISQSLVAGVLGDKPGVWVSDQKRLLIVDTARDLGYRPNAAARMLRSGTSNTVAFVTLRARGFEQAQIIEVLAGFLQEIRYELSLKIYAEQSELLLGLEEMVRSGACAAVFLDGAEGQVEEQARLLERLSMPFIVKGRFERTNPTWPQVDFDHERMMDESVRRLVEQGHHRIAYLGYASSLAFAGCLQAGFTQSMLDRLSVNVSPDDIGLVTDPHLECALAQTEAWLSRRDGTVPTALVVGATSEATWRGIELALARRGRVMGSRPEDFMVTGLHYERQPLLFGQAQVFSGIDALHLTDAMCRQLLAPILQKRSLEQPIVRIFPNWRSLDSLELLNTVEFRRNHMEG